MKINWSLPKAIAGKELAQYQDFVEKNLNDLNWSEYFSELLWRKGWHEQQSAVDFIEPDLKEISESYKQIAGCIDAAEIIKQAAVDKTPIIIFGDYDVDGITSTAILWRFLYQELNLDALPYLPHREKQGYGLNRDLLEQAIAKNKQAKQILITLDCGIRDYQLLAELKAEHPELIVIITDHHQLPDNKKHLPNVDCIVHPLLPKSTISPNEICAAAIAWNLTQATRVTLKIAPSNEGIELVALATVCDLMPLLGINRSYVKVGLKEFTQTKNIGLNSLLEVASINKNKVTSYDLGFVIGPRINATGRIGDPVLALKLLCTQNPEQAKLLATEINELNQKRQAITLTSLLEIDAEFTRNGDPEKLIFLARPELPEGIIGLVAGKLQDRYKLPTIVTTKNSLGNWVGSARSIPSVNITNLLNDNADLLVKYGGHAQAAGFTVSDSNLVSLKEALISHDSLAHLANEEHIHQQSIDLNLPFTDLDLKLYQEISLLEPFGYSNDKPLILVTDIQVSNIRNFGKQNQHSKFIPDHNPNDIQIIWFKHEEKPTPGSGNSNLNYAFFGYLGYNEYNFKVFPQLIIKDRYE